MQAFFAVRFRAWVRILIKRPFAASFFSQSISDRQCMSLYRSTCVCASVRNAHAFSCMCACVIVQTRGMHARVRACMHACLPACMHTMCVRMHACLLPRVNAVWCIALRCVWCHVLRAVRCDTMQCHAALCSHCKCLCACAHARALVCVLLAGVGVGADKELLALGNRCCAAAGVKFSAEVFVSAHAHASGNFRQLNARAGRAEQVTDGGTPALLLHFVVTQTVEAFGIHKATCMRRWVQSRVRSCVWSCACACVRVCVCACVCAWGGWGGFLWSSVGVCVHCGVTGVKLHSKGRGR